MKGASCQTDMQYFEEFGQKFLEKIVFLFNRIYQTFKNDQGSRFSFLEKMNSELAESVKNMYDDHIENFQFQKSLIKNYVERGDMLAEKVIYHLNKKSA